MAKHSQSFLEIKVCNGQLVSDGFVYNNAVNYIHMYRIYLPLVEVKPVLRLLLIKYKYIINNAIIITIANITATTKIQLYTVLI